MVLALVVGLAILVLPIVLIMKLSGRRFPGDITGPQGNDIDYENPYPGWWSFFTNGDPGRGPALRPPPAHPGPVGAPDIEFIKTPGPSKPAAPDGA